MTTGSNPPSTNSQKRNPPKYREITELGKGGMAEVYLCVPFDNPQPGNLVVLKKLRENLNKEQEFITMFLDEARLAARLNHPNVIKVFEVGEEQGRHYLTMQYVEGQTLSALESKLGMGPSIPLKYRLFVLIEALKGLQYAHELCAPDLTPLHVVHRDVSPQNIFITYDGQIKLLDFGIAKAADSNARTNTGVVKGKVTYMSPEQAMGDRSIDSRADIFAVGVLLWEALAAQRMYEGMLNSAIVARLLTPSAKPIAPSTLSSQAPEALEHICLKALQWRKQDRYVTANELREELERWVIDNNLVVTPKEIGAFVETHFIAERQMLQSQIDKTLTTLRRSSRPPAAIGPSTPRRLNETASSAPNYATDSKKTGRYLIALVIIVIPISVGLIVYRVITHGRKNTRPMVAHNNQDRQNLPRIGSIKIRTIPEDASLYWDNRPLGKAPYAVERPLDGTKHSLRAEAQGYQSNTIDIKLNTDISLEIVLEPEIPLTLVSQAFTQRFSHHKWLQVGTCIFQGAH